MNTDCIELQEQYKALEEKYTVLEKRYAQLEQEYSENTIIESMNDMKNRYNHLVENTVSLYKYESLQTKYDALKRESSGSCVLIDHIIKLVKALETETYISNVKNTIYKIQLELLILKEILEDAVDKK